MPPRSWSSSGSRSMQTTTGIAEREVRERLARIAARDAKIQAWEFVDADGAIAAAQALDQLPARRLNGWTVGVKDIIDVDGMPTTWGSEIYAGNVAVRDAACVALARNAGAVTLGKTVSTEFAFAA